MLDLPKKDWQPFIDRYVKDGEPIIRRDGSVRIQFVHDSEIGTYSSADGTDTGRTCRGSIHLSKSGAHIVPERPAPKEG